jgi:fucose permease
MISLLLLIIIYIAFISLGLPDALLGSAWPSMYNPLNVPLHYAGVISMIIAGGTVVSSLLSAGVIKKCGTGPVTLVSVTMTAGALVGFSFSQTFAALCRCAVPLGLGAGSVDAALNNYVAVHYKARHMSWLHCFWGVGASLGPMIMAFFLMKNNAWNLGYRTVGIIQFCFTAILLLSLPLWGKNKQGHTPEQQAVGKDAAFGALLRMPGVKQLLLTFFCYCAIEATAGLWGSSYLVTARNIAPQTAAQWISLYYIGITFGRFISGFLTIKLNNRQMVRLGQAVIACGIIMLVLPFDTLLLLPGFFIIGLGCAPIYPSLIHETPISFGTEHSQAIIGMQMASAYIGTTFMPLLFGRIASASSISFSIFPLFLGLILLIKIIMVERMKLKLKGGKGGER